MSYHKINVGFVFCIIPRLKSSHPVHTTSRSTFSSLLKWHFIFVAFYYIDSVFLWLQCIVS